MSLPIEKKFVMIPCFRFNTCALIFSWLASTKCLQTALRITNDIAFTRYRWLCGEQIWFIVRSLSNSIFVFQCRSLTLNVCHFHSKRFLEFIQVKANRKPWVSFQQVLMKDVAIRSVKPRQKSVNSHRGKHQQLLFSGQKLLTESGILQTCFSFSRQNLNDVFELVVGCRRPPDDALGWNFMSRE